MRTRKSAYYSRNESFSRSYNAEVAEEEGRLPRSRAAAHLGLSALAFDAGCRAASYVATEWHHVGKYATRVYYYDCDELASREEFWAGAAAVYKSAKKRAATLAEFTRRLAQEKAERLAAFRAKLEKQRDCTIKVRRHNSRYRWECRCARAGISGNTPLGDLVAFDAAVAEKKQCDAEKQARRDERARDAIRLRTILAEKCTPAVDSCGRECFTVDGNLHVRQHGDGTKANVWHRLGSAQGDGCTTAAAVIELIERRLARTARRFVCQPVADCNAD